MLRNKSNSLVYRYGLVKLFYYFTVFSEKISALLFLFSAKSFVRKCVLVSMTFASDGFRSNGEKLGNRAWNKIIL